MDEAEISKEEIDSLPIHYAGTEGNKGSLLTIKDIRRDENGKICSLILSGTFSVNDNDSIKKKDLFMFIDDVPGFSNLRLRSPLFPFPLTSTKVQFRVAKNASSNENNEIEVHPFHLDDDIKYISNKIQAGMKVTVFPDHRHGIINSTVKKIDELIDRFEKKIGLLGPFC